MAMPEHAEGDAQSQKLLDAAMRVFARRGFKGASVREIAAEAGMTTGAIYYHYADKDALLAAAIRRDVHYVHQLTPTNEDGTQKSSDEFLSEVNAATARRLADVDRQRLHQVLVSEVITLAEDEQAPHRDVYEETIRKTARYFAPALGTEDSDDAYYVAGILTAALDGMAVQSSLGLYSDDVERMTSVFEDFFVTSIRAYLGSRPE